MRTTFHAIMVLTALACTNSVVLAAELLEVKPVVVGNSVSVEISADIPMTYTFYKDPGQTRTVLDIAEVDPEKVEPLIVVNKGVVSSISVDKAQVSGITVSRIIFNLMSESDISVNAAPDRKLLTVTFGGSAAGKPGLKPDSPPVTPPEPIAESVIPTPILEQVSTATAHSPALSITDIVTGASYIEIRSNQPVTDYKVTKLTGPDRLVIDIGGEKINQEPKSIPVNRFKISKVRIGVSTKNIRIVFDSDKVGFPAHEIANTEDGLRINFK